MPKKVFKNKFLNIYKMDTFFMDCESYLLENAQIQKDYNFTKSEIIKNGNRRIYNINWMKAIIEKTEIKNIDAYVDWVIEGGGDFYFD